MRILICLFLVFSSFSLWSQDVIETKAGGRIECKVYEITESTVRYYSKDQPDGPIRNISVTEIAVIIYADGTRERFVSVNSSEVRQTEIEKQREEKPKVEKDHLFKSGFFLDVPMGVLLDDNLYAYFGISPRVGNKWYFGSSERYRFGIQATWGRIGVFSHNFQGLDDIEASYFSLPGIGVSNVFKFKPNYGLDINLNFAPAIIDDFPDPWPESYLVSMDIRARLRFLALGFDFTYLHESYYGQYFGVNLCLGFKF